MELNSELAKKNIDTEKAAKLQKRYPSLNQSSTGNGLTI
jgi:hypothetical protein